MLQKNWRLGRKMLALDGKNHRANELKTTVTSELTENNLFLYTVFLSFR